MKIVGYVPLLYGKEYLDLALTALQLVVDETYILYTAQPSYGQSTSLKNPDSKEELQSICSRQKVVWHEGQWFNEGHHRDFIYKLAPDADIIVTCDADEIFNPEQLQDAVKAAYDAPEKDTGINGFVHFWRSFRWANIDVWQPIRIIKPSGVGRRSAEVTTYHFGYAQNPEVIKYKIDCHGHKNEWRREWYDDIYLANRRTDNHPVVLNWWNAQPFDETTLPDGLKRHPNFEKEII